MSSTTTLLTLIFAISHQFQTGYHISALNGIQSSLVCDGLSRPPVGTGPGPPHPHPHPHLPSSTFEEWGTWMRIQVGMGELKGCIDMQSSEFGLIVAMFTLGGLVGSLSAERVTRSLGRIGALRFASSLMAVASLWFALANTPFIMLVCRCIIGFASGLTAVNVPLLVGELRPDHLQTLGISCQLTLVVGLIVAQALALPFARPYLWRWEMVVASGLAAMLLFFSLSATAEPAGPGAGVKRLEDGRLGEGERTALLDRREKKHLTIGEVIRSKDPVVRSGLMVIVVTQVAQQLSGISPVVFFSTSILQPVFPGNSGLIAVLVLCIKFPASVITLPLLPRWGSRLTLTRSYFIMCISLLFLAFGLNHDIGLLSCWVIVLFFLGFGLGPGPVPWVVLSEVLPVEARTAAGSLGLGLNCITGFIVSSTFLPLQELLTTSRNRGEGNIFFAFALACLASTVTLNVSFKRYYLAVEGQS